ncbi:MAG: FGGY family carbohydrate kinase [Candidatus Binatia bacterium]|nr:FGGY family carbohydrate kinase [Candidatus Binatia bacterium]
MSAKEHVLGIDEGTTGVRAAVVHADGTVAGRAYVEVGQAFPHPGWVEHDPSEIWQRTQDVVAQALAAAGLAAGDLTAVGVTNQRGSGALFDASGRPHGPVIGWQDQRTTDRCGELLGEGVFVIPMAAASKYEWLVQNYGGDTPREQLRVGTLDSWLAFCLSGGGVHATDHSNLSVSGLYDFMTGEWDERAVEALGLDARWLPQRVQSSQILGETSVAAFGAAVPIASLAGDQHASMYALACHRPGDIKLTLGTSGMLDRHAGTELGTSPEGAYPLVLWALDDVRSFCFESAVITAGATAQWLRDGVGVIDDLASLEPLARSVDSSDGVWMVPSLQGLGSPYLDTGTRGLIGGVSRGTTRAHLARAALEGIAWRCAEAFVGLAGDSPPDTLRVDGGAAVNGLLLELLADATGVVVESPKALDSAVLGSAYLAGRATGLWSDDDVVGGWASGRTYEPKSSADERASRRESWGKRVALVLEAGS